MPSSLTTLLPSALGSSPHPPVSVYGTGSYYSIAAFLDGMLRTFATSNFAPRNAFSFPPPGFSWTAPVTLEPVSPFPAVLYIPCPCSSDNTRYRNLHLFPISYGSRPRLRPRLTQGRSALPWNPWIFGRKDSHLPLATHSGILSSLRSTTPLRAASSCSHCSPTNTALRSAPRLRRPVSAPDIFGAEPLDQ